MVPDTETEDGPVKVSMDYMYVHERRCKYRDAAYNPPHMIMIEHARGRCWAYRVPNKGIMDEAHWLPERTVQHLENAWMNRTKIQFMSDQEPSIVSVQKVIMEMRPNTIPTNSPVGESECNGRIENIIRMVQEKVRVLRHQVEQGIRTAIPDNAPTMSWLVRWAAELLSKYSPGDGGKTPCERIRNETCMVPLVPFGEIMIYLPLQTVPHSKGEPIRQQGVWLGTIQRTEEVIVGTTRRGDQVSYSQQISSQRQVEQRHGVGDDRCPVGNHTREKKACISLLRYRKMAEKYMPKRKTTEHLTTTKKTEMQE